MPVQVGDLVGFYRRKSPGMGIVLDKIDAVSYTHLPLPTTPYV